MELPSNFGPFKTLADAKNVALGWAYLTGKQYGVWANETQTEFVVEAAANEDWSNQHLAFMFDANENAVKAWIAETTHDPN